MGAAWKDYFLRSGLPLENDVKRYLDSKGCISDFRYSYLRRDESELEKEFSYDIDASYIKDKSFIELMIECKYRHESTRWIFLSAGPAEINSNDFLHPIDHFIELEFPFKGIFPEELAPLCSKGIELTSSGDNEKSINQAMFQLSYAFAQKVASAIEHQVHRLLVDDHIFFHVPVIVTTARLYRLKENVDIDDIKKSEDVESVSEECECLLLKNTIGKHLEKYNAGIFDKLRRDLGDTILNEKLNTFTNNIDHLFNVLAAHCCPKVFVVTRYSRHNLGLESLFKYIDRVINPPADLLEKINQQDQSLNQKLGEL